MFVDDWYVMEVNECNFRGKFLGITSGEFKGVPGKIKGVFKYFNGHIYFLTENNVLEYNVYLETVSKSESSLFKNLQLTCVRESLVKQLYELIRY
ncbi:hypothetical protein, partial [Klebsiella pneumoniae]|uniref:hypothetical protein n=1 Tax=Klebsiella pneumoniae TaxID=573 RepID=UPI001C8F54D2